MPFRVVRKDDAVLATTDIMHGDDNVGLGRFDAFVSMSRSPHPSVAFDSNVKWP